MFSLVKEYLEKNKVVITYVKDALGFKIGVVVAIGIDQIGWSMVNHRHDYESRESLKLHQLPAIQRMVQRIKEGNSQEMDIFQSKAYKLYSDLQSIQQDWGGNFKVPHFDRNEGLRRAIEMAENGTFDVDSWMEYSWQKPLNAYMRDAITNMIERSRKVIAFKK